jgi:hypothetical protein
VNAGIRDIYAQECGHVRIDKLFFNKLCDMESGFVNKKQEHIEFFGGNTTGVQVVRFTTDDFDKLFNDLLEVDETVLEERVHQLPDINPQFLISSDIFNVTCVWLLHAISESHYLSEDLKVEAKLRVALYLNYRFLTSILFRFFKYPANPETAAATYAQLSYRYLLKAKGSWSAALKSRCEEIINPEGIHAQTISKLEDDYEVVKMLNDIQGRIKDMVKNIYSVFMKVHTQGTRIGSSSTMVESDGEMIMKDKDRSQVAYTRYVKSIISDKNSFYKQELFDVIAKVVNTAPEHAIKEMLDWISANYTFVKDGSIEKSIDLVMEHAFMYLSEHRTLLRQKHDVTDMLVKMRGTYNSARATDEALLQIKQTVETLVRMAIRSKNDSVISSVRTAFCLYVLLRAFTMRHYQSK